MEKHRMERGNWSRRGFLACVLGGLGAAGIPLWFARETIANALGISDAAPGGANEPHRHGRDRHRHQSHPARVAGCRDSAGARGIAIMRKAMHETGVQMIAVCDVDRLNAAFAKDQVQTSRHGGTGNCLVFDDFRRLLDNRDITAVTVGTPDHWHALIAIAAMRAGKDVYCEKPLTLTVDEGQRVGPRRPRNGPHLAGRHAASASEFDGRFRLAAELVRNGRIGGVERITALVGGNMTGGPFQAQPVPAELD